jgi:hypothetical protein
MSKKAENNLRINYNSESCIQKRGELQAEINKDKVKIDYSIFKKTEYEHSLLAKTKLQYKLTQKRHLNAI